MGDGDGTAALDLLLKQRDHAAVAAQNVAEAHGDALHIGIVGKALDQHFAQALGAAHNVGGVDRLVGGKLHKPFNAMLCGGGQQIFGAHNIVFDGLGGADLHQRDVLVRGGVEYDRRVVGFKNLVQTFFVADRTNQGQDGRCRAVPPAQLGFQLVGAVFVNVKNQEPPGLVAHDLAAKLAADGTAAAGDQHDFVVQIFRDLGVVQLNFIAGKKVRRVQFAEARRQRIAAFVHRVGIGNHTHAAMGGIAKVDDFPHTIAVNGGDGDNNFHNMVLAHQLRNVRDGAAHRHALHAQTLFGQIIVNDADRLAEGLVFAFAQGDCPRAGIARTHDEHGGVVAFTAGGSHGKHGFDQPP